MTDFSKMTDEEFERWLFRDAVKTVVALVAIALIVVLFLAIPTPM